MDPTRRPRPRLSRRTDRDQPDDEPRTPTRTPSRPRSAFIDHTESVHMLQPHNVMNVSDGRAPNVNLIFNAENTLASRSRRDSEAIFEPVIRADHEIYYHQLLSKKRGAPLWVPGPGMQLPVEYRRQGISIGDVGIITSSGQFDFLFNIFQPADHPINIGSVPRTFSPLPREQIERDIQQNRVYGPNSYLASPSVRKTQRDWTPRWSNAGSPADQTFESSSGEAAILTMPDGASTQDLLNERQIRQCITENAQKWYTYARNERGRNVRNGDIRVVIGVDKVTSWGIATSTCNSATLTFSLENQSRSYHWECTGGSGRVGPDEIEISDIIHNDIKPQNQCVFVRTMNFTLSGKIGDSPGTIEQPVPVSENDNRRDSLSTNRGSSGRGRTSGGRAARDPHSSRQTSSTQPRSVIFDHNVAQGVGYHPSAALHTYLHKKFPDASMVITQDSDWISVLHDDDTLFPQPKELVYRILKRFNPSERDGIVTIRVKPGYSGRVNPIIPPQNGAIQTSILYPIGLAILWVLYWFRSLPPSDFISLPFHVSFFTYPLLTLSLWLFGPFRSPQFFSRLTCYMNLMVATTYILVKAMWNPPAPKLLLTYAGIFSGLNTGLQVFSVTCFFLQRRSLAAIFFVLCMLHGELRDPFGFYIGVVTAAASFYHSLPDEFKNTHHTSPIIRLGSDKKRKHKSRDILSLPAAPAPAERREVEPETVPSIVVLGAVSPPLFTNEVQNANMESQLPAQQPLTVFREVHGISKHDPSPMVTAGEPVRVRRRQSVVGPRGYHHKAPSSNSVDFTLLTQKSRLFVPPSSAGPSAVPIHVGSVVIHPVSNPSLIQARWNDNLFELEELLGESSSQVTSKVREKRSGLLFVRKIFYPRQTSGIHIVSALSSLISHQDCQDASSNVVRCYGAYLPEGKDEGVRAIFEFCEGGSLHSISRAIAQRGEIVGEKIAGQIASGMLQGLSFLHGLKLVHLKIRPNNVFITLSGMVKLSEPEIPGEGAVALTDRFMKAVWYASPERIMPGNPLNPSKSDVWALGITLLEFIQNRYPYPELPTVQLMVQIVQGEPPQLKDEGDATYSPKMKNFFTQCLLVNETDRPAAQELLSNPWVLSIANQQVHMDGWIREVLS